MRQPAATSFVTRRSSFLLLVASIATVIWVNAGDLNPPAGPVAPTMKTLAEVEPRIAVNATNTPGDADSLFKITQPGSYYLTANISGVVGKHGIEIAASGVTLDLNGFELLGVAGSLGGVSATVLNLTSISVLNGSIGSWGVDGVDLTNFSALNSRLVNLRVAGNTGMGIRAGLAGSITGCTAYFNTGNGINTGNGCTITGCVAYDNSACPNVTNGTGACNNSVCTFICNAGFGDCNANAVDGCETNLNSGVSNCGGCGIACPNRQNATTTCVSGMCGFTCNAGFRDCNATAVDGCEVNMNNSVTNCGNCGTVCSSANGTPTCSAGVCGIICNSGFANCDANAINGCEINTNTDRNNCGNCGHVCPGVQNCVSGVCQ